MQNPFLFLFFINNTSQIIAEKYTMIKTSPFTAKSKKLYRVYGRVIVFRFDLEHELELLYDLLGQIRHKLQNMLISHLFYLWSQAFWENSCKDWERNTIKLEKWLIYSNKIDYFYHVKSIFLFNLLGLVFPTHILLFLKLTKSQPWLNLFLKKNPLYENLSFRKI